VSNNNYSLNITDIFKVNGGPSPVAVFEKPIGESNDSAYQSILKNTYRAGFKITKIAQIDFCKNSVLFTSIQVINKGKHTLFDTSGNCGNSMSASIYYAYRHLFIPQTKVVLKSAKSDFSISAWNYFEKDNNASFNLHIDSLENFKLDKSQISNRTTRFGDKQIPYTLINIANPYIILPAERFGVNDVVRMTSSTEDSLITLLSQIRKHIIQVSQLPLDSEFPKVAIVSQKNESIQARTIYLNKFHPGLPLTGVINLIIAYYSGAHVYSSFGKNKKVIEVFSPSGPVKVYTEFSDDKTKISSLDILDRKVRYITRI